MFRLLKLFIVLVALTGLGLWGGNAVAAPAWLASSAIAASTGVDVTVTLPTHAANDILLLQVIVRDVNDTITWPTGWAQIATVDRGTTARYWWAWRRAASAAEPNPLVNKSGATGDTYAAVTTYRGAITTGDPWEVKGTPNTSTTAGHVLNGITTLTAESLIVASLCGENNSANGTTFGATDPASLAQRLYVESGTGSNGACTTGAGARATVGATGNVTATWTATVVGSGGIVLALKPPDDVQSINRVDPSPTAAASVSWIVTFYSGVTGVSSSNFTLVNSGLGGTPAITSVTGSGTTWTVTASTGTGTGTLGLNMTSTTGVSPAPTNLPFTGQVYSVRPPVAYYHDTTNGVNIGFDGTTNVNSGSNVTIPPIITASLLTTSACTGSARSANHPTGLYTHSRWYLTTNYAGNTDIGANPIGSASLYGNAATDTVIVRLYDYDPVLGAKVLIGSSSAITLTGGQAQTPYRYTISSALYTVPAGHRLMLEYNFNQPVATNRARVYCSAADAYIAVTETASPPVNCTSNASSNWSLPATWINCRGGIPLASDAVTILAAHSVTLNTTTPILGNLTNGGTLTASGANTLKIGGNFINTGTTTLGSTTVNLYGDFTNNNGANFNLGTAETGTWNFLGTALQNINDTVFDGTTVLTTFPNLLLNNTSGIALNASATIKTLLTLTNGYISTGGNILILSANCTDISSTNGTSWVRTNGFVAGNVRLNFLGGATTCTYPVGSGSNYAPIDITMVASTGGTLTGSTTGNEHPQIATSGIDSTLDVNRFWTLWMTGDTVAATSYGATFNFVPGDKDALATPTNFVVGKYAASAWTLPTTVTATTTSTGFSSVAGPISATTDFAVGEKAFVCSVPADLPSNMSCQCDNFGRASVNPSTIFGGDFTLTETSPVVNGGWPKIVTSGRLQMTDNASNYATSATIPGIFPAAGNLVSVEFLHYAYRTGGGIGADGIAVTLSADATPSGTTITPLSGAYGGSLGYAQKTGINGFAGGWIGVGIDEYGNFSNPTEGRVGGPAAVAESVAVRGSGSGVTGYPYLGGTAGLSPVIDNTNSATPARGHAYRVQVDARCYLNKTAIYTGNFALNCATANASAAKWARVRVYRDTTGAGNFGAPLTNLDFEAYAAALAAIPSAIQADVPVNWRLSYTGSTGSSINFHEIGALKICAQTITPPSGYRIQVDNLTPSTCGTAGGTPSSPIVTVTALDTNGNPVITYNKTVTLSAPLSGGGASSASWSLKSGNGTFTAPNQYAYVATDLGVAQFYLTDASPQSVTVGVSENDGTISSSLAPPPIVYAGGSFTIANIDALAADTGGGVVAGRPHKMSITRSNGCTTDTTYTGVKNLDGWYTPAAGDHPTDALAPQLCAANSSGTCLPTPGTCQTLSIAPPTVDPNNNNMPTLTFGTTAPGSPPNGVAYFCLATSDVGKYSVSLRDDSAASVVGSSGTLTARPFAVVVSGITGNPAGRTDTDPVFTSAGSPFPATVGGYLWSSSADTGANGLPGNVDLGTTTAAGLASHYADTVTLAADTSVAGNFAPVAPPATQGSLSSSSVTVSGGSGSSSTLAYSEVGSFTLKATPASSYLNSGVDLGPRVAIFSNPASASQNKWVGRFKPHHFTLYADTRTNRAAGACSPAAIFTYLDEGLDLTFTLSAEAQGGWTTTNYVGYYAKLVPTLFSNYAVGVRSGTTNLTPRMSGAIIGTPAWAAGVLSAAVARVTVAARSVLPSPLLDGPWTSTQFGMAPSDSDGTQLPATALNLDVDNNAAFDHQTVGATTELRFGRLRLLNAFGSERMALPMSWETQYWNGDAFVRNAQDGCTSLLPANITMGMYTAPPNPGPTVLSASNLSTVTVNAISAGLGTLTLAPTANATGSVAVVVNLGNGLAGPSDGGNCTSLIATSSIIAIASGTPNPASSARPYLNGKWCGSGSNYDQDPFARASFGVYKSPIIYRRENY